MNLILRWCFLALAIGILPKLPSPDNFYAFLFANLSGHLDISGRVSGIIAQWRYFSDVPETVPVSRVMLPDELPADFNIPGIVAALDEQFVTKFRPMTPREPEYITVFDPSPHIAPYRFEPHGNGDFWRNKPWSAVPGTMRPDHKLCGSPFGALPDIRKIELSRKIASRCLEVCAVGHLAGRGIPCVFPYRRDADVSTTIRSFDSMKGDRVGVNVSAIGVNKSSPHQERLNAVYNRHGDSNAKREDRNHAILGVVIGVVAGLGWCLGLFGAALLCSDYWWLGWPVILSGVGMFCSVWWIFWHWA